MTFLLYKCTSIALRVLHVVIFSKCRRLNYFSTDLLFCPNIVQSQKVTIYHIHYKIKILMQLFF